MDGAGGEKECDTRREDFLDFILSTGMLTPNRQRQLSIYAEAGRSVCKK
jgi:hypothetical protein